MQSALLALLPTRAGSSSSDKGSPLITGCVWGLFCPSLEQGLLEGRAALWPWHHWRFPAEAAAAGKSSASPSPLFSPWWLWRLPGGLTPDRPSLGPAPSLGVIATPPGTWNREQSLEKTAEGGPRGQMCGREGPAQSPSSLSIGTEELYPTWEGVGSAHCILEGWSLQGGRGKYYGWAETGEAPPLHLPPAAICTPNLPSFLNRLGRVCRWSPPSAQACAAELRSRQGAEGPARAPHTLPVLPVSPPR